jgi:hypothetical protein
VFKLDIIKQCSVGYVYAIFKSNHQRNLVILHCLIDTSAPLNPSVKSATLSKSVFLLMGLFFTCISRITTASTSSSWSNRINLKVTKAIVRRKMLSTCRGIHVKLVLTMANSLKRDRIIQKERILIIIYRLL